MTDTYSTLIPAGGHWSLRIRRGMQLSAWDIDGGANLGMLFYNPENLLERYNAPDTLKCQHTFRLTQGNCLYSDMGRIFCSVVDDSFGGHDTMCGNTNANDVATRWGVRDYQSDRNDWKQNGNDAFLVELAKYGLGSRDMAASLNLFSRVLSDADGNLSYDKSANRADASATLRFEMDTLVVMHNCPHPLNPAAAYPRGAVRIDLAPAAPVGLDDTCRNHCDENRRGFENNRLYHFGISGKFPT